MPKTTNNRQPLTYEQIDALACGIAQDLTDHEGTAQALMLLMSDASKYPSEQAESIANLLLTYLFAWQPASDTAEREYVEKYRQQFLAKHSE
jgi:hypothetical protein